VGREQTPKSLIVDDERERALLGEHPGRATLAGVAFGFVGVALLLLPGGQPAGVTVTGLLLVVLAVAFVIGAMKRTPLATWQWMLLVVGLSQRELLVGCDAAVLRSGAKRRCALQLHQRHQRAAASPEGRVSELA